MGNIIAIGGGELRKYETRLIDEEIIKATGKERPQLLFIPTASNEAEGYVKTVKTVFGDELGCAVDVLYLIEGNTTMEVAREQILKADIVYVGGGNTKKMLEIWHQYEIDTVLKDAFKKGTVLSGLSAGSICWFGAGHSDSQAFTEGNEWHYIKVKGLELIQGIHCPHFDEGNRREDFLNMMCSENDVGIALENNTAIYIKDDSYKILKADLDKKAYKIYHVDGKVQCEEIKVGDFRPLSELYSR